MRSHAKMFGLASVLLLVFVQVSAQEMDLKINKKRFRPGDKINITAEVSNPFNQDLSLNSVISPPQENSFSPRPLTFKIDRNTEKKLNLYSVEVKNNFPSGNYETMAFLVQVDESLQKKDSLASEKIDFEIINTKLDFNFSLRTCPERECDSVEKVVTKEEAVYLDYIADASDLKVNASLTYPNGSIKKISLPSFIEVEGTGTYRLKATATKPRYLTKTTTAEFGVIAEAAKFKDARTCFANGVCEPERGENAKTCPQDCAADSEDNYPSTAKESDRNLFDNLALYLLLAFTLALLIFLWYR